MLYKMRPDGSEVALIFGGGVRGARFTTDRHSTESPMDQAEPRPEVLPQSGDRCVHPGDKFRSSYRFMIYLRRVTGGRPGHCPGW